MLTAEGVEFVESERVNIPVLNKLPTIGSGPLPTDGSSGQKIFNSLPNPVIVRARMMTPARVKTEKTLKPNSFKEKARHRFHPSANF